jgi:hypothetical protein
MDVHTRLCDLVAIQAATNSAWASYARVMLGPEAEAFFAARLPPENAAADFGFGGSQPSNKRDRSLSPDAAMQMMSVMGRPDSAGRPDSSKSNSSSPRLKTMLKAILPGKKAKNNAIQPAPPSPFNMSCGLRGAQAAIECERCGCAVKAISLRVACMDGSSTELTVPERELILEIKRTIAQVLLRRPLFGTASISPLHVLLLLQSRGMDPNLIELFVDGTENALPDSGRLNGLGLGEGSVVFMLMSEGWGWSGCSSGIELSRNGLVATTPKATGDWQLATGGSLMTDGRHYWEVELTSGHAYSMALAVRATRTRTGDLDLSVDHDKAHEIIAGESDHDAYHVGGAYGALYANGQSYALQAQFAEGDRIGVLLDLDAGWMRFYRNGKRCGPGFTEGVTGPLVRGSGLYHAGEKVTVLQGAKPPPGAGDADEPWEEHESEGKELEGKQPFEQGGRRRSSPLMI